MRKLFLTLLVSVLATASAMALNVNNTAGQLAQAVGDNVNISSLVVTGTMDARDFLFITNDLDELTTLDLSQVTIAPYNQNRVLYGTVTNYAGNAIPRTAFFGKKLTSVVLPQGLEAIGYAAFAGCYQLRSITIPESVTLIGDYAFSGTALTSVTLPSSIVDMGKGVFSRCEDMTSADINCNYIGEFAFLGDINLSDVKVGPRVNSIGEGAFNGCAALKTVEFDPACRIAMINGEAFINSGLESIDINSLGTVALGDWAFAQTRLTTLKLADGMTRIGEGVLAHNRLLETVTLPNMAHANRPNGRDSMTPTMRQAPGRYMTIGAISDYAFAGDENLNPGNMLKKGVATIGDYAFYNVCNEIDTMRLPETIVFLGDSAMAGMTGMKALKTAAADVPELGQGVWAGVDQPSIPLITPSDESTELYKAADQWMYFFFEADDFVLGDVNGDGIVNISDVTMLIDHLLSAGTEINERAADMNGDGVINISDVTALIDYLLSGRASNMTLRTSATEKGRFATTGDALVIPATGLRAGQTRTIDVALNNDERAYVALQGDIVLPEGLTLDAIEGIDRGSDYTYYMRQHEAQENIYTMIGVSMSMTPYAGNEGNVMRLTVTAGKDFQGDDAELVITGVMLVSRQHEIFLSGDAVGKFNDATAVEQLNADREIASVRYINVAGQESETPFDGMNIVVTTYTDGTMTTVKVMK